MDPGTAIGLASLAIQLLGGCIQGFVLLTEAHNIGRVGNTLVCLLSIQELRLVEWAKRSGLLSSAGVLDVRLNVVAVQTTLTQLKELLGDVEQLSKRYGMKLSKDRPPSPQDDNLPASIRVWGIPLSEDIRKEVLWRAKLIQDRNSLPKRLWWAAVDREKFKELVADVRVYVQELWSLLDPVIQDDMIHAQQLTLAKVIALTDKVEEIETLRAALANEPNQLESKHCLMPLGDIAAVKLSRLTAESADRAASHAPKQRIITKPVPESTGRSDSQNEIDQDISERELINFTSLVGRIDVGMASYKGHTVFVEWKYVAPENRWKLIKRVQQLAHMLHVQKPISFRSLHCIGLCMDDEATKAGFIFRIPHQSTGYAMSLRDMLGGKSGPTSPSVTARIQLALDVLRSIQYFHIAGWMHKDLRSENIQFFRDRPSYLPKSSETGLEQPFIVGFSFARLDVSGEVSERPSADPPRDIYRHPHALEGVPGNSTSFMDLYSIGTILVELAEWRPLSTLLRDVIDVKKDSITLTQLSSIRRFICKAACDGTGPIKLDFRMGRKYARAARLCLGAETLAGEQIPQDIVASMQPNDANDVLEAAIQELSKCVV
nr:hypothetical protein CFP56_09528 [Quercus suber]